MASVQAEFEERPATLREEEVVMSSCLEESLLDVFTLTIVLVLLWKKKIFKSKTQKTSPFHKEELTSMNKDQVRDFWEIHVGFHQKPPP